ncbi:DMT family transporter [Bacillus salipaludis]|uniref:DMT family transporter n=1 Tax=Bacillus salipaludis TaxID=2547811 RepID=A0ABW8RHT2_9BACI
MKPIIALLILSLLWGSSFLWTKELLTLFESPTIVFLRSTFGLLVLAPLVWMQRKHSIKKRISKFFLFVVALGAAIPWTILGFALEGIDTGLSGILNATTPMFTILFSILLLKTRPQSFQIVSLILGFIAVIVLLTTAGQAQEGQFSIVHAILMFCVTISYALNSIWVKKNFSEIPALTLGFWTLLVSAVLNGVISLINEPTAFLHLANVKVIISLIVLGCFGSGLGYVIFYWIISVGGPLHASMVTFLAPFVTITLGVIFLGEPMHYGIIIGLIFMILSLLAMNWQTWKKGRIMKAKKHSNKDHVMEG